VNRERTLNALLDVLIPPSAERGMPGAGELDLAGAVLAVSDIVPHVDGALALLGEDFAARSPEERHRAVEALAAAQPMALPAMLFHLYRAYYAEPRVLAALGMPPRPPYPEGYEVEPNELGLLERVRAREKIYREV
jgi:hypothetical protein